jgi:hypothetical protein
MYVRFLGETYPFFFSVQVVRTLDEFNKLHKSRRTFSWSAQNVERSVFDPSAPLRQGAIIWTVTNRTLMPLSKYLSKALFFELIWWY